jgi:ADP-ribose pyrophosphatase
MHTLSFDKRRDRGECELPQLAHALFSVESLVMDLMADDFHLKIRAEKPASYPPRQRISIDEAPWFQDSHAYDPPYFVDPSVLENDRTRTEGGWADPEQFDHGQVEHDTAETKHHDKLGRPLNPRGRTGIAGRGLLGRWGSNPAVAAVVVRTTGGIGGSEVLVGQRPGHTGFELPEGFVLPGEQYCDAMVRVVKNDTGWEPAGSEYPVVFRGYIYDPRQTDHAWVDGQAYLIAQMAKDVPDVFDGSGHYEEFNWMPLDSDIVNQLPLRQAQFVRNAIQQLLSDGLLAVGQAEALLAKTG